MKSMYKGTDFPALVVRDNHEGGSKSKNTVKAELT